MNEKLITQIRIRVSNPQTVHDMARGLSPPPRVYPKAIPEQISATERTLGFSLPDLLKQIYLEIGNGGFGPGYGLIGVQRGYADFSGGSLSEVYAAFRQTFADEERHWPKKVVPVCTWGCGIYSCADCGKPKGPVLVYDPDLHVLEGDDLEASSIDAEGNVVWSHRPRGEKPPTQERPRISLSLHKGSFRDWIEAWAQGVDLWQDMQRQR